MRGKILWQFMKLAPHARRLELELQKVEQDLHDLTLANQIHANRLEMELEYKKGFNKGVQWCLEKSQSLSL